LPNITIGGLPGIGPSAYTPTVIHSHNLQIIDNVTKTYGRHLPGDIGLIGVGNVRYGDRLSVPLSTLDLHPKKVGITAASMVLSRIKGEHVPSKPLFLEPELIIRDSSRRNSTLTLHLTKTIQTHPFAEKVPSILAK
jgi:hypothetical protein